MKRQLSSLLSDLRTEQLEILTTLVKETLATNCVLPRTRTFTSAELWSIQRQGRSRVQRRFAM